jgi:hypothetical protein
LQGSGTAWTTWQVLARITVETKGTSGNDYQQRSIGLMALHSAKA